MALCTSNTEFEIREVVLRDKPSEMLALSPKGTVPVLVVGGTVLDESLDIMNWSLQRHDPEGWIQFSNAELTEMAQLVQACDSEFKAHLDRYKYADRHPKQTAAYYRDLALPFLAELNRRLASHSCLFADRLSYADVATFPFIRQFANVDAQWFASLPYPGLQHWLSTILDSDLFRSIMLKYPQWHAGDETLTFPGSGINHLPDDRARCSVNL
jgi:glutathione S-transferase